MQQRPADRRLRVKVGDALVKLVTLGRVVVACFASNVARVSVFRAAHASERRVGLLGRSLDIMVRSASIPVYSNRKCRSDAEHLGYLPDRLAVATGTQGEIGAALR